MFARRNPKTRWQAAREIFWPSMGLYRLMRYYKHRMGRLQGTPYAIAAGFATGVAMSFTPFIGLHIFLGGIMAWVVRGSLVAMVLGTVFAGNLWTFPLIWIGTLKLGEMMLGREPHSSDVPVEFSFTELMHKPLEFLLPMTMGSAPFFVVSWALSFYFVRHLMRGYRDARRQRIAQRRTVSEQSVSDHAAVR